MPNLKPFIWGVVVGAIALPVLGFTAFSWRFDSKAQAMARDATDAAMKKTLVPVCVAQFRADPDTGTHLAALKAKKYSHQQTEYVGLGGWFQASHPASRMAS